MDKSLLWCVIVLLIPMGVMLLCMLWARLINNIFHNTPYNKYDGAQTTFYKVDNKKIFNRKHPPHATFFSKVDGQEKQVDGPYEEKWLTVIEKWNWKVRR